MTVPAHAALPHRLAQIATDGAKKIPQRWLQPLAINAAPGQPCPATLRALAAWMLHGRGTGAPVVDPLAVTLAAIWARAGGDGIVEALIGAGGVPVGRWMPDEADRALLREEVQRMDRAGR